MDLLVNKNFMDRLCSKYETGDFIVNDPIAIPHRFTKQNDIEIAAFLASSIAWGNRKIILRNAHKLMDCMDSDPYNFVVNATENDLKVLENFVHRTFNHIDLKYFIQSLRYFYMNDGSLGQFFEKQYNQSGDMRIVLEQFYNLFFSSPPLDRTKRHISSITKGSACKRLNMFLRWMVRGGEVDFGLWHIPTSALYLPLDVHSSNVGRKLGLLNRAANDWKAVEEITANLRQLDSIDPIRYDFALFSAGIEGEI